MLQFWFVRMSWRCSFLAVCFGVFARPKKFFSEGNEGRAYALPLTLDRLLVFDDGGLAHILVKSFCQHLPNLEAALISR